MRDEGGFRAVYESGGVYDRTLLPHFYDGRDDLDLVAELMDRHFGSAEPKLQIAEFGCGTGRVTARLMPYARHFVAVDDSATMIAAFSSGYPRAETINTDSASAVEQLLESGRDGWFDVVGAFWSLSYPIGAYFETMSADRIQPTDDTALARQRATRFIRRLVELLAPGGHLLALFFDAETPEQRMVTHLWERIAPFPEQGRAYTKDLLIAALREAEDDGKGTLTHIRRAGVALAPNPEAARAWFNIVHLKGFPALVDDPEAQDEIADFVKNHTQPSGRVTLPSGVHMIDFHAVRHPSCHLPDPL